MMTDNILKQRIEILCKLNESCKVMFTKPYNDKVLHEWRDTTLSTLNDNFFSTYKFRFQSICFYPGIHIVGEKQKQRDEKSYRQGIDEASLVFDAFIKNMKLFNDDGTISRNNQLKHFSIELNYINAYTRFSQEHIYDTYCDWYKRFDFFINDLPIALQKQVRTFLSSLNEVGKIAVNDIDKHIKALHLNLLNIIDKEDNDITPSLQNQKKLTPKIFISHSTANSQYAEKLIDLLNAIGVPKSSDAILCSSVSGYHIPLGENIYDYLRKQFEEYDLLVLFLLSDDYYGSAASLNEMGAAWVLKSDYRAILLPRFEYKDIDGAIDPRRISMKLDNAKVKDHLEDLKEQISQKFDLKPLKSRHWEMERNKFLNAISRVERRIKKPNQPFTDMTTFIASSQATQLTPDELCTHFMELSNWVETTLHEKIEKLQVLFSQFSSDGMFGYGIEEENSCSFLYVIPPKFGTIKLSSQGAAPHSVFLHRNMCLSGYKNVLNDDLSMTLHISMTDYVYSVEFEFKFADHNSVTAKPLKGNSKVIQSQAEIDKWITAIVSEICFSLSGKNK